MTYIYFLALYFLIAWSLLQNFLLIAVFLVIVFTWRYGGITLILLAMLVDGYFGTFSSLPVFSLVAVVWYVTSELIRPHMRLI